MTRNDKTRPSEHLQDCGDSSRRPYTLIVRGSDGQPRSEDFQDVATYRARLARLTTGDRGVALDEIVRLLEH